MIVFGEHRGRLTAHAANAVATGAYALGVEVVLSGQSSSPRRARSLTTTSANTDPQFMPTERGTHVIEIFPFTSVGTGNYEIRFVN